MRHFRCIAYTTDAFMFKGSGIEHEGKLWIVTAWLKHPDESFAHPERLIRFDNLPHRLVDDEISRLEGLEYQGIQLPITAQQLERSGETLDIEHVDHPLHLSVPSDLVARRPPKGAALH